jgi:hypothetical protein
VTQSSETKREKSDVVKSAEEKYGIFFYEIIDNPIDHLSGRFSGVLKMGFFSLLNCEKFDTYGSVV